MNYPFILRALTASGLLLQCNGIFSQNISVNTTGAANSTSSMFEVLQPASAASNSVGIFARNASTAANAYAIWAEATAAATNKYAIVVPSGGGKVGIGTSTPSSSFHLADATGLDVGPWMLLEGGANVYSNTGLRFWDKGTDLNNENVIEFGHNSTFVSAARIKSLNPAINATTGGRLYLETASNNTGTYNTNQLVLNNNGRVGVGTLAPDQNLSVYNGMSVDQANLNAGTLTNGLSFGSASGEGIGSKRTATGNQYGLDFYTAFNNRMSITSGGYVGINTSSPVGRLDVYTGATATDAVYIRTDPGANPWQGGIVHHQSTTYGFKQTVQNTSSATLGTMQFDYVNRLTPTTVQKSNILVLQADGNIGAGTLSPSSLLHLQSTNTLDAPRGDILLSRYWASNADTRASSVFHYYNSATGNDNLAFGVSGGGGTNGQPNALSQIKMIVQGSGNVGIGTTAPGYKLTLTGGALGGNYGLTPNYANWSAYGTGDGGAAIYNDNAGYQKLMIVGNTSGGGGIRRIGMWDYLTLNGSGDITGTLAVGRTTLQAGAQVHVNSNLVVGDLAAGTNQTLEVIPAGGDVYIGSATQEGDLFVRNMAGTGNVHFSGGAFSSHYILNGYFGLGTSTPGNQLTVTGSAVFGGTSGTSGEPIEVRGALSGIAHKDRDGTSTRWVQYASGGLMRLWNDANGDRMVVNTAGDVGIGTTAPGHRLHVVPSGDNTCIGASSATGYLQFLPGNTGNGSYNNIVADDDNAIIFGYSAAAGAALSIAPWQGATTGIRINCPTGATALVGINRRATTNALEVSGDASKTVAAAWLANSDRRIKTDIQVLDNAVATIMKLRPVKFKYSEEWKKRNPEIDPNRYYYNFIAQEYKEVFPESVKGSGEYLENDPAEILQIDTYNSQIVAIKAIQEQQVVIEQLKEENRMLKDELYKTKNENDSRLKKLEAHLGMTAEK